MRLGCQELLAAGALFLLVQSAACRVQPEVDGQTSPARGPILVSAPLAAETAPKEACPDIGGASINNSTLMPDDGSYELVFELYVVNGMRNYSCEAGGIPGPAYFAVLNATGDQFSSIAYNDPNGLPKFELWDASVRPDGQLVPGGREVGSIYLDLGSTAYVPAPSPENLAWARWPVFMLTGGVPWVAYVTRVDTQGGQPPAACDPAQGRVLVPFEATYLFWTCT